MSGNTLPPRPNLTGTPEQFSLRIVSGMYIEPSEDHDLLPGSTTERQCDDVGYENAQEGMFMLADGVGSQTGSELAAVKTVETMSSHNWPEVATDEEMAAQIKDGVGDSHRSIPHGLSTTLIFAHTYRTPSSTPDGRQHKSKNRLMVAGVGDSRMLWYRRANGQVGTITPDDAGQKLVSDDKWETQNAIAKAAKPEDLSDRQKVFFAIRNEISQAVGGGHIPDVYTKPVTPIEGDVGVLLTDGVYDFLTIDEIFDVLMLMEHGVDALDPKRNLLSADSAVVAGLSRNPTQPSLLTKSQIGELINSRGDPAVGARMLVMAAKARSHDTNHFRVKGLEPGQGVIRRGSESRGAKYHDDMSAIVFKFRKP